MGRGKRGLAKLIPKNGGSVGRERGNDKPRRKQSNESNDKWSTEGKGPQESRWARRGVLPEAGAEVDVDKGKSDEREGGREGGREIAGDMTGYT
jgi:hypothetical protein